MPAYSPFGVLADHDPVDLVSLGERRLHARQHACRAHVVVLVESLADGKPQAPQRDVIRHLLASNGAEEDGVHLLQLLEAALGDICAVLEIALGAPVVVLDIEREALGLAQCLQHFHAGADHFRADAVCAHGRDPVLFHR
jgi:hypothetical protein